MKGYKLNPINIASGTRKGCSLSPLIIIIVLESSLAIAIRSNPDILGIESGGRHHKCALTADDLLLFITSPYTILPNLMELLHLFEVIMIVETCIAYKNNWYSRKQ